MEDLDSILNSDSSEPVIEAEAPTEQPPETIGQPRDEHGRFASVEPETGVEQAPEPETVPPTAEPQNGLPPAEYAALRDERRKRQEAEQRALYLEQQFQQMQPAQQLPAPVDFWEDPHQYMARQFDEFGQTLLQRFEQRQQQQRVDASEAAARAKYSDYAEKVDAFRLAAAANPALVQQMTAASDPAEFAYSRGKTAIEVERYGSVEDLIAAERAKWEAELKGALTQPSLTAPSTIANERSVSARAGPAWVGPAALDSILR